MAFLANLMEAVRMRESWKTTLARTSALQGARDVRGERREGQALPRRRQQQREGQPEATCRAVRHGRGRGPAWRRRRTCTGELQEGEEIVLCRSLLMTHLSDLARP